MKKRGILLYVILGVIFVLGVIFFIVNKDKNTDNRVNSNMNTTISNIDQPISNTVEEENISKSLDKVTMTIKEGTLTKTGSTVIITDNNEEPYGYGEWFRIDKKEEGKWKEVKIINEDYTFNAIGILLSQGKPYEDKIDWSDLYGELKEGEYRLVKEALGKGGGEFWVEFTID